ncbi:MAG: response regulator [Bryobacteraceae bacterium]
MHNRLRVLIIDDNRGDIDLLRRAFEPVCDAEFTSICDGESALETIPGAAPSSYDLVLIDWRMPGVEGDRLAMALLDRYRSSRCKPAIVVLSSALPPSIGSALESKGAIILGKPADLDGYDVLAQRLYALAKAEPR